MYCWVFLYTFVHVISPVKVEQSSCYDVVIHVLYQPLSLSVSLFLPPPGWERGYSESNDRYFFFNSRTGASTWSIQEVYVQCGIPLSKVKKKHTMIHNHLFT